MTFRLAPTPPPGITIAPPPPAITVRAHRTVSLNLLVTVGCRPGARQLRRPLRPSVTEHGKRYGIAAVELPVSVPYPSLAAGYDAVAISDDHDVGAADFDGFGNSYSEQALTSAGLAPGATVTVGAATLQWPRRGRRHSGQPGRRRPNDRTRRIPVGYSADTARCLEHGRLVRHRHDSTTRTAPSSPMHSRSMAGLPPRAAPT